MWSTENGGELLAESDVSVPGLFFFVLFAVCSFLFNILFFDFLFQATM